MKQPFGVGFIIRLKIYFDAITHIMELYEQGDRMELNSILIFIYSSLFKLNKTGL